MALFLMLSVISCTQSHMHATVCDPTSRDLSAMHYTRIRPRLPWRRTCQRGCFGEWDKNFSRDALYGAGYCEPGGALGGAASAGLVVVALLVSAGGCDESASGLLDNAFRKA
eukprot:2805511-Amphidinium_carterae.1